MGFWGDWELWEKMCFVLGCLIVLVLLYGTGVHVYNNVRLKKFAAAEAQQKAQEQSTAQEAEEEEEEEEDEDDIPFGSRALESGIEVEGIWISNNNTPVPSPRPVGTPRSSRPSSSASELPSQSGATSGRETQHQIRPSSSYLEVNTLQSSRAQASSSAGSTEKSLADDPIAPEPQCRQPAPGELEEMPMGRLACQSDLQSSRYNGTGPYSSATDDTIKGNGWPLGDLPHAITMDDYPSHPRSHNPESYFSQQSENGNGRIVGNSYGQAYPNHVQERLSTDGLEPLHSHRRSHVAETGQLGAPRNGNSRPPGSDQSGHAEALSEKLDHVATNGNTRS
ncbi:hypothetical protein AJ80_06044 [Polytolypa hystricis UAMH7299]|uniref:Uncharacterized protein n=1 Tax=Polytolypa hystricis (strain UAMH7299) TaxID=1447883 RepID=A0A2B7XZ04_POLH7|nr:hypothetical protein AJ80_06044 [Polytolypa hystricis UAMH7299]